MKSIRILFASAFASLAFVAGGASAQQPAPEFTLLSAPQPTEGGGKVEVIEFFWYGCPHCARLEPFLQKWASNLPKDVVFKRIHALPSDAWMPPAVIFFTLEAMGQLDKLHMKVFEAIHDQGVNLNNVATRDQWLAKNGVDPIKFTEVSKSFSVQSKLTRARQMTGAYKVDGVPMVIVNGKYVTSNTHTRGDTGRIVTVVEQLVERSRKENAAAK